MTPSHSAVSDMQRSDERGTAEANGRCGGARQPRTRMRAPPPGGVGAGVPDGVDDGVADLSGGGRGALRMWATARGSGGVSILTTLWSS